jgi:cellulose biosynthesis protein BcsQ
MKQAAILAVGNVKGGVGKTTLAVNLAIWQALHGKDVLLVDGDEQGTARAFTQCTRTFWVPLAIQRSRYKARRSARSFGCCERNTNPS